MSNLNKINSLDLLKSTYKVKQSGKGVTINSYYLTNQNLLKKDPGANSMSK